MAGPVVAGALLAALAETVAAALLAWLERSVPGPAARAASQAYRAWLAGGGWAWIPLWGAALGLASGSWNAAPGRRRAGGLLAALALAALPLVWRPVVGEPREAALPRSPTGKALAMRRWAFRDPASVARIVTLSRDPSPLVREQAMLALGINLVVADLQAATPSRPSGYARAPLRDSLRLRLEQGLRDPAEAVRAEAARALWKAPRAFGPQPAAAETLAAVLERGLRPGVPERLAWLALDAAAAAPHPALASAAARFAATVPDSDLARAARRAVASGSPASGAGGGAAPVGR